jgi:hypothetical protein
MRSVDMVAEENWPLGQDESSKLHVQIENESKINKRKYWKYFCTSWHVI